MHRRTFLQQAGSGILGGILLQATPRNASAENGPGSPETLSADVLVYGSTPGGISAAVEAARRGCRVILACPKPRPGGMSASGLGTTDAVRRNLFGGFVIEFVEKVRELYRRSLKEGSDQYKLTHDGWYYEPSVAEAVFREILHGESERLQYLPDCWLSQATVTDGRITGVSLDSPGGKILQCTARTFIDATYEGDLAAAAKVPYRVGREGREEFGEPFAGIHYMNWRTGRQILTPDTGEPSIAIQAFCCRSIFTDDPAHRVPIEKPAGYDEHLSDYLPLLGDFESGRVKGWGWGTAMPNRKWEMNGDIEALTSLNCPGISWAWPEAGRHHRAKLETFHRDHAAGLIWFLQNDSRVPSHISKRMKLLGLHDQEFTDTGHWPWQMYVRQGRRIEGRAMLTQHSFTPDLATRRTPRIAHPIALGEHSFDIHPCHDRRYAVDGFMEGVLWYPKKAEGPAQPGQIPYEALLPKKIDNLLVPVAMSCTHVAMSVLRMEPVWMTTGQIAGLAAAIAQQTKTDVANIDPILLAGTLKIRVDPEAT